MTTPQAELAEHLDDVLRDAVHLDGCYIDPDETHCVCLIGSVKAALPQCEEIKRINGCTGGMTVWRCVSTAHPSSPDRHVFAAVSAS